MIDGVYKKWLKWFQSPKAGRGYSDDLWNWLGYYGAVSFNPLRRGGGIQTISSHLYDSYNYCYKFQSPKAGRGYSDMYFPS